MKMKMINSSLAITLFAGLTCISLMAMQKSDSIRLIVAVKTANPLLVKQLLDSNIKGNNVETEDNRGSKLIHIAAQNGNAEIVGLLLAAGASINSKNSDLESPLNVAARNGHANVIQLLSEAGADQQDKNKSLLLAASVGKADAVRKLISLGVDVNNKATGRETPLNRAANCGHDQIAQILIDAGADLYEKFNENRFMSPLFHAAYRGRPKVLANLLAAHVNPNELYKGDTVLQIAANGSNNAGRKEWGTLEEYKEVIKKLLQAGADLNVKSAGSYKGEMPIDLAKNDEIKLILVTHVTPQEVQHLIPAIITLSSPLRQAHNLPFPRDVGRMIASQLIPDIVEEKLPLAKKYLPNYTEAQLREAITQSINRTIHSSPYITKVNE